MCNVPESNRAEIGPIELATKYRGNRKKGVSVRLVTLDKVALGGVLHVVRYCIAVSADSALHLVGCCMRVAAEHIVLCMVHYYITVTACATSCTMLGMLSQFGCCI